MNRCSLCGLTIEKEKLLHNKCINKVFNVNYIPKVNFTLAQVVLKAQKMTGKLSISGIQPKLSVKLNQTNKELEVVSESGEYILKPPVEAYPNLPQNENLCMTIASNLGISVPLHTLIKLQDNKWAYIIKRFDRFKEEKIHQEDFCQILGKKDKYEGSFEEIGKKLKSISSVPGLDIQYFYERVLLYFIIGNGDAHMKNFSITYKDNQIRLSPAYDIICSKIYIPDESDFALSMNGKRNKISRKDFERFLDYLKIPNKRINQTVLDKINTVMELIKNSELEDMQKNDMIKIVQERLLRLKE